MALKGIKKRKTAVNVRLRRSGLSMIHGQFEFHVKNIEFSSLTVPAGLAFLVLSGDEGASRFLRGVVEAPILDRFKEQLFKKYMRDPAKAWKLLEEYIKNKPNGPAFYMSETSTLDLTDGRFCFRFWYPTKVNLPLNVYCELTWPEKTFDMSLERLAYAQSRIEDFFEFMKRLYNVYKRKSGLYCDVNAMFKQYFEDPAVAWRMMDIAENLAKMLEEMDACLQTLQTNSVIKCGSDYFVWCNDIFYVTGDGGVFKVSGVLGVNAKEVLYNAVKKGIKPDKSMLAEERRPEVLRRIAQIIGKVDPTLTVVILP